METWSDGKVRVIAINRPQQRNAVNQSTARLLYEAFEKFNSSDVEHVAVLFGKGGNFCAGYDLKELSTFDSGGGDVDLLEAHHEVENAPAPMVQ